jgi:hypothetical protein
MTQEQKKIEEQRFEFLLYINNHIICQRFFNIKNFNEDSIKSYEIKELMDDLCGMNNGEMGTLGLIPNFLKQKSEDFIWSYYNPYTVQTDFPIKNNFDKNDIFQFEIRVDKKQVAKTSFSGGYFPPKVKYAVDIKELIPSIIAEIREFLSRDSYNMVVRPK